MTEVEGKRKREWIKGVGVWGLMRTCCCLPICQQRLWSLSAAGTHNFPQVWILLEQDLCSSHGKELVPLTPTLLNGTQKGKDRKGGGNERETELERASFLAHTFKTKQHCIMEIWPSSSDVRVMLTALRIVTPLTLQCLVHTFFLLHTLTYKKESFYFYFVTQITLFYLVFVLFLFCVFSNSRSCCVWE